MLETIKAGFWAIAAVFGFVNRRTDLNNQPDVKQAAKAQDEVNAVSKTEEAVRKGDLDEIRKELAE